jgi:hypothetical protein
MRGDSTWFCWLKRNITVAREKMMVLLTMPAAGSEWVSKKGESAAVSSKVYKRREIYTFF